jgi:hypothetical protein
MPAYLSKSFGGSTSLVPTLAGLRLVTDTRFGKPEPYSQHAVLATRASNTRHLQFAPAIPCAHAAITCCASSADVANSCAGGSWQQQQQEVPLAAPLVSLPLKGSSSGSGDLAAALLRLQQLCCLEVSEAMATANHSDMVLQTSATLARLVAAAVLSGRLQLQLKGDSDIATIHPTTTLLATATASPHATLATFDSATQHAADIARTTQPATALPATATVTALAPALKPMPAAQPGTHITPSEPQSPPTHPPTADSDSRLGARSSAACLRTHCH